jgi:hypothetical protein
MAERGEEVDIVLAPDGSARVELHRREDERTGPWETVSVVGLPDGEQLTWMTDRPGAASVTFPAPGVVELSMADRRKGELRRVRIDLATRSFRFEPTGAPEPLAALHERLGWNDPPKPYVSPRMPPTPLARFLALIGALVALVFVAGGLWMALTAATTKDRWTGALGAVLFGACAYSSLKRWRSGSQDDL